MQLIRMDKNRGEEKRKEDEHGIPYGMSVANESCKQKWQMAKVMEISMKQMPMAFIFFFHTFFLLKIDC